MSDWKLRGIERRDARHTATPDHHKTLPAKKNTRRWCKGVEGREHKPIWFGRKNTYFISEQFLSLDFVCTVCKKRLSYWWRGMRKRYETPQVGSSTPLQPKPK